MLVDRPRAHLVTLELPLPPSVNAIFVSRHGSRQTAKGAAYGFWRRLVQEETKNKNLPKLHSGYYGLWLDLPATMRGDIDNRVKVLSDMLRTDKDGLGVVHDDKLMIALYVGRVTGLAVDRCVATLVSTHMWYSYVQMRLS